MSPYDVVRENLTARQVAEYYGLKVKTFTITASQLSVPTAATMQSQLPADGLSKVHPAVITGMQHKLSFLSTEPLRGKIPGAVLSFVSSCTHSPCSLKHRRLSILLAPLQVVAYQQ